METDTPALVAFSEAEERRFATQRRTMVRRQLRTRDITDERVLEAMGAVSRHHFVAERQLARAYDDYPLPAGFGQTISQPYIVALMTQLVRPTARMRVLDLGTGTGYQAAVTARLVAEVYGIEIVESLAADATARLAALGYDNVTVRCGDGYHGWKEHAPFDAIIAAAAPEEVPRPLTEQLSPGGRLVIPVGRVVQDLIVVEKRQDGTTLRRNVAPVRFVPMTGTAQQLV